MRKPSLVSVAAAVVLVALVSCALATPSMATEVDATLAPAAEPALVELTYVEPVDRDTEEEVELAREELAARVARLKQEQRDLARRAEIRRQLKKMQTMTQRSFRQLSLRRRAWSALDVNERCQRTRMQYNATEARIEKINKRRARNLVRRLRAADRKCTTAATQRCRHLFAYRIAKSTCERVACRVRHQFRGRYQMCEKNDACQDDLQRCIALKAQLRAKFRPCADNAVAKCVKRHRDRTDRREKRFVAKQAKKLALAKLRVAKECGLTK